MGETTEATMARAPPPSKPSSAHNHPPYAEMIISAIRTLNEKKGSSRTAIDKFITAVYLDLPPSHSSKLTAHLRRLKDKGRLVMVRHSYKLPNQVKNPVSGEKRGRGRPPKTKSLGAPEAAVVKRPRGRPRKVEGLDGGDGAVVMGKKRGRPPKKAKTEGGDGATSIGRPRGRPRKVKVEGGETKKEGTKAPRGRPRKLVF
eukprot:TRINITY_DN11815_c1_g1_i1.p1 TRINITY_DN11815_c1_g1~~TRINITY_DN11815_c1_g1_i1.p1  ORF type:complete len:201 (-),score=35.75 TRINITY_DN11815_c1_g1_i1:249-851(-)